MIGRLLMILVGLILTMLGVITALHSQHFILGLIILFSGFMSMLEGLPKYE